MKDLGVLDERRFRIFFIMKIGRCVCLSVKIVIPVVDGSGLSAELSGHFGRAPFFAIVEVGDDRSVLDYRTIPNDSEHFGGSGRPPDRILQLDPDVLITYGMGRRALDIFQNARVAVLRATSNVVGDVIAAYHREELEELTEGCRDARHQ